MESGWAFSVVESQVRCRSGVVRVSCGILYVCRKIASCCFIFKIYLFFFYFSFLCLASVLRQVKKSTQQPLSHPFSATFREMSPLLSPASRCKEPTSAVQGEAGVTLLSMTAVVVVTFLVVFSKFIMSLQALGRSFFKVFKLCLFFFFFFWFQGRFFKVFMLYFSFFDLFLV